MQINFDKRIIDKKGWLKYGRYIELNVKCELDNSDEKNSYSKLTGDEVVWSKDFMYYWTVGSDFGVAPLEQMVGASFYKISAPAEVSEWDHNSRLILKDFKMNNHTKNIVTVGELITTGLSVEFPDTHGSEVFIRGILMSLYKRMKNLYFVSDKISI